MTAFMRKTWLAALAVLLLAPAGSVLARDIGEVIEQEYGVVDSSTPEGREMNERLDRVVERIAPAAGLTPKSAKVLGAGKNGKHKGEINALALPDGRIYVMSGLMEAVKGQPDEDAELAFVVGHEITHVAEKHSKRQNKKNLLNSIGALVLGAVTRGSQLVRIGSDIYVNAMAGHYSRKDEYAADRGALRAMLKAGYPPEAAAAMLERIRAKYGDRGGGITSWFASHPPTKNRIKEVRTLTTELEAQPTTRGPADSDR